MTNNDHKDVTSGQNNTELCDATILSGTDIPDRTFSLLMEYSSYQMIFMAAFGLAGNILVIITYSKIGFSESIIKSYCTLGVSDILYTVFLTWNAICFIPAYSGTDVQLKPSVMVVPTTE